MNWNVAERNVNVKAVHSSRQVRAFCLYLGVVAPIHLAWEILQLPLYTIWNAPISERTFAVVHCTAGDAMISAISLAIAVVATGKRDWPMARFRSVALLTVAAGLVYTSFSEWLNVAVREAWAYSSAMPLIPMFGFDLGVSPVAQWVIVPAAGFAVLLRWRNRRDRTGPL